MKSHRFIKKTTRHCLRFFGILISILLMGSSGLSSCQGTTAVIVQVFGQGLQGGFELPPVILELQLYAPDQGNPVQIVTFTAPSLEGFQEGEVVALVNSIFFGIRPDMEIAVGALNPGRTPLGTGRAAFILNKGEQVELSITLEVPRCGDGFLADLEVCDDAETPGGCEDNCLSL